MARMSMAAARVNAKLTQAELADKMGVTRVTVHKWETGKSRMKTVYVYLFCKVVGISPDDFILPKTSTKCKPTRRRHGRKNT